ncbi:MULTISPECIES: GFA family protein [Pseudomonas]|jgi:hypothetical protein|uniref:GFA family protein n=1 Tax=Pseudomonas sp. Hg7Tf TaxID=3236988 RepID=A0AB39HWH5_9PSED|nr:MULTISPECIES: GFA family protein [Pseudomonas]KJK05699.1 hypothetical protein UB47_21905 [Pseudomonas sp. 5]MDD1975061.1 GFA family protein [Pseudomonas putida]MDH2559274.1 GFA family protein [Pseudomonas sp. Hg5Tf]
MTTIDGGCLCGSVHYSSAMAPLTTAVCHCTDCQKQSGSAFSINLLLPAEGFVVQGNSLANYEKAGGSGHPVKRFFCNACGSALYSEIAAMPGVLAIKAGTLSNAARVQPGMHLWCASALPWVTVDRDLPCFEQAPSA